jgi:hypothetical protein
MRRRAEGDEEGDPSALNSTTRRSTHQAQRRAGAPPGSPAAPNVDGPRGLRLAPSDTATEVGGLSSSSPWLPGGRASGGRAGGAAPRTGESGGSGSPLPPLWGVSLLIPTRAKHSRCRIVAPTGGASAVAGRSKALHRALQPARPWRRSPAASRSSWMRAPPVPRRRNGHRGHSPYCPRTADPRPARSPRADFPSGCGLSFPNQPPVPISRRRSPVWCPARLPGPLPGATRQAGSEHNCESVGGGVYVIC